MSVDNSLIVVVVISSFLEPDHRLGKDFDPKSFDPSPPSSRSRSPPRSTSFPSGPLDGKELLYFSDGRLIVLSLGIRHSLSSVIHSREKGHGTRKTSPSFPRSALSRKGDVSPSRFDHGTRKQWPW
jgi:hypothetical protein